MWQQSFSERWKNRETGGKDDNPDIPDVRMLCGNMVTDNEMTRPGGHELHERPIEEGLLKKHTAEAKAATAELIEKSGVKAGQILVIGCSTSEILGSKIGTDSQPAVAKAVFEAIWETAKANGLYLAAQCCEHLNRAIIIEQAAVPGADIVNVVPQPKAGGSFATQAYAHFTEPVAVEEIRADAGLDIGFTMIGMHLKKVAGPLRLTHDRIGEATVLAARTRPKFIGGERAVYDREKL